MHTLTTGVREERLVVDACFQMHNRAFVFACGRGKHSLHIGLLNANVA